MTFYPFLSYRTYPFLILEISMLIVYSIIRLRAPMGRNWILIVFLDPDIVSVDKYVLN